MNTPERVASALAGTLAIGSTWLFLTTGRVAESPLEDIHQPALYITAPQWDMFDERGRLKQRLQAARMEQQIGEDAMQLRDPRLVAWREDGSSWQATARNGQLHGTGQPAILQGDVVLNKTGPDDDIKLTLKTSHLLISPSGEHIETEHPVTLQAGHWKFTADGLQAHFDPDRIKLSGRVRGRGPAEPAHHPF